MSGNPWNDNTSDYPVRILSVKHKGEECKSRKDGTVVIDWCNMVVRLHNGCHDGGAACIPIISKCPDAEGNVPVPIKTIVVPPIAIPVQATALQVKHDFGYIPTAQLVTEEGEVMYEAKSIRHIDVNTLEVAPSEIKRMLVLR